MCYSFINRLNVKAFLKTFSSPFGNIDLFYPYLWKFPAAGIHDVD